MDALARLPAIRLSSASCSRSSREVIKRRAAVELIDDLEDRLLPLLRRSVRRQQPADSEMRLGAQMLPGSGNRRLPGRGRGGTYRHLPSGDTSPVRTASCRSLCSSSFESS